ncbi:Ig-like domain-containing protein, partial [Kluyvera sichuanensis]|uniref:Ig-like domain-containing protein n=1 Tax=Kluyvera sichuanensis TaxID=2725494 RepID=UPI002FD07FF8
DKYGNEVPESASTDVAPAPLSVEITIDPITNDDVLNFSDIDEPTTSITGKVTGGASEGDEVTLSIGGEKYFGTVVEVDGALVYKIDVPTSSLLNDSDLKIEASVASSDKYGNEVTASKERGYDIEKGNVVEGTAKSDSPVSGTTGDSDIVLADVKGNIILQGQDYNICFVLDTSGSMVKKDGRVTIDRLTPAKNAILEVVKSLIQSAGQGAGTVTIGLITFAADASLKLTIDLSDPNALSRLETVLKGITANGNTDYYDAFNAATDWFKNHNTGAENITYFITDGEPNLSGSNKTSDYSERTTIEAFDKLNAISDVEAIGLGAGVNKTTLDKFDSDKSSLTGIDPSDLAAAIQGKEGVMAPGDDIVNAGAGNDIIFGDIASFAGDDGTAADLRSYITAEMKLDQPATDAQMHVWITENQERLDGLLPEAGGKDALFGGTGNDLIFGGGGNDLLVGGEGNDTLYGGHGDDILIGDGPNSFSELANLLGNSAMTVDEMMNALRNDVSKLGTLGGGSSDDVLHGGDGNDLLYGGEGNDTLYGGTGNDILIGGKGNDTLYGGSGSDTFTWLKGDDGHDVIKDFRVDEGDRIDLSDLLGDVAETDLASYIRITDDSNGNAVIEINTNGELSSGATMSITVEHCSAGDFNINDLIAKPDTSVI